MTAMTGKSPVSIKSVEMIFLLVEDLEKSRHFYRDLLGLEEVFEDKGHIVYELKDAWLMIAPEYGEWADKSRYHGWGFALYLEVEDVDGAINFLQQQGVQIYRNPTDRPWGLRDAGVTDPDGYHIYFCKVLPGSWEGKLPPHALQYP